MSESYSLKINELEKGESDFFLENLPSSGYARSLNFFWVKKEKTRARITFAINKEGLAKSLPWAPFGGFWLDEKLSSADLEVFIHKVIQYLKSQGSFLVSISQAPKPYVPSSDLVGYLLFKLGFQQKQVLSHQFFLGKKRILKFAQKNQKKFQNRLKENGLTTKVEPISNFGFLREINVWNKRRGYDENIDESKFIQQVSLYPERYYFIGFFKSEKLVAAAIAVRLVSEGIYYYKSAIDPSVTLKQGGDLILHQLFSVAANLKANFIDLGSSDNTLEVNHTLIYFKSRFSNDISNKITWELKI